MAAKTKKPKEEPKKPEPLMNAVQRARKRKQEMFWK